MPTTFDMDTFSLLADMLENDHALKLEEYEWLIARRTPAMAAELARRAVAARKLVYGDAVFTRGLIDVLPGGENAEVSSPSFTLCNSYPTTPPVVHCDLYRSEGALPDEVDEALDAENGLVLVEWAERIADGNLPPKRLDIRFQVCKNNRLVTLSPHGEAACSVLQKLARVHDSDG